jgi:ribonuclease D
MTRPLRDSQISYAARDATLLLPLLRTLGREADERRGEPEVAAALARLPAELAGLKARIRAYRVPSGSPMFEKVRRMGLGAEAERKAQRLLELRYAWGNEGDVAAVMEMGARWILARLHRPPRTREELERSIPNPRFRRRRLEALWEILGEPDPVKLVEEEDLLGTDSA